MINILEGNDCDSVAVVNIGGSFVLVDISFFWQFWDNRCLLSTVASSVKNPSADVCGS